MKFNVDNKILQGLNELVQFIGLNLIFLFVSLPLITIGPALSAMFSVTFKQSESREGYIIKDFWKQFMLECRAHLTLSIFFLFILGFLAFQLHFWMQVEDMIGLVFSVFFFILELITLGAFIVTAALLIRFDNTSKQTIQNAFLMVLSNPIHTLILLAIPATLLSLGLISPFFRLLLFFVGWAFSAYCSTYCLLHLFKKYQ